MLLIYSNPATWESLTEEERRAVLRDHTALDEELAAAGEYLGGAPLADPSTTRTVRVRDGMTAVTDGPFTEAKEHLAGYDLLECDSIERATEIALRHPEARLCAIEVRPVVNM